MARQLNAAGSRNAASKIASGDYDDSSSWSFGAEDGDKLLGANGDDWAEYARWFLGENTDAEPKAKARYSYPFGKGGKVYSSALRAIRSRASQQGDTSIFDRAGALLDAAGADDKSFAKEIDDTIIRRAYSVLHVKELKEEERTIRGVATTPSPDRVGDIIEPLGVNFKNPMPFLWQHQSDKPIGLVNFDKATRSGIKFEAKLPKVTEPGILKDRVDEAWQSIKYGLVAGASIGFRPLKDGFERMEDGGIKFKSVEVMELSAVTIPANQDCTISLVKSLDQRTIAAIGTKGPEIIIRSNTVSNTAPVSTDSSRVRQFTNLNHGIRNMKTIGEQITALENMRAVKAARMEEVLAKGINEGRTPDEAEEEEFDNLQSEVASIDKNLMRLQAVEKLQASKATPVAVTNVGAGPVTIAPPARVPAQPIIRTPDREKGIGFAQVVKCIAAGRGNLMQSHEMARHQFGPESDVTLSLKGLARIGSSNDINLIERAAVQGATTTDGDWAGPLAFPFPRLATEFIEFLRPATVLDRIPGTTQIPFNVNIASQTTGGTAGWVGEGAAKPLTQWQYSSVNFRFAKIAAIVVQTEELMRFSSPSSDALFRNELVRTIAERQDLDFLDPTNAGTTNVKPASVSNGVAVTVSTGNDAAHVRLDIANLMATFDAANINLTNPVFVMSVTKARALSLMRTDLGVAEFDTVDLMGTGSLMGIPIVSSQYVTRFGTTGGEYVFLLNAEDIFFADDGQVTIDASREASLQMDSAPTEDASGGGGTTSVSMFQTNSVAIRAERFVNWQKRRSAAVAVLGNVFWGHSAASGT